MKCEVVQSSIASGTLMRAEEAHHLESCPQCRAFQTDLARLEARFEAMPPVSLPDLREATRSRLGKREWSLDWRSLGVAGLIFAIVCGPTVAFVAARSKHHEVKGEPFWDCPPFHSLVYGYNRMSEGDPCSAEIWYSGHAYRIKFPGPGGAGSPLDMIDWIDGGDTFTYTKVNGKLKKRQETFVRQGKATPDEMRLITRWQAPLPPLRGMVVGNAAPETINQFGKTVRTRVETIRLIVQPGPEWTTVESPTRALIYREVGSNRIVRIAYQPTFGKNHVLNEIHDFDYSPLSDSLFDPDNLTDTPSTVPARPAKPND